jgi:hypothetical protein
MSNENWLQNKICFSRKQNSETDFRVLGSISEI